jgi:hypothetical protein
MSKGLGALRCIESYYAGDDETLFALELLGMGSYHIGHEA